MNRFKSSTMKKVLVTGVAALSMLVGTTIPAAANAPGAGVFIGHEYAPESDLIMPSALCAEFKASQSPLVHELEMTGTFHGVTLGTGTATFTATTNYFANPEGTHSDGTCLSPGSVSGEMVINFAPYTCSGDGTYMRRAISVYTLEFDGTCSDGTNTYDTNVLFSGGQEPCDPIVGCITDPSASSLLEGDYIQTDG